MPPGCPIRISTDQCSRTAPRRFSQFATSFVASWCLGIHHAPFLAYRRVRIPSRAALLPPARWPSRDLHPRSPPSGDGAASVAVRTALGSSARLHSCVAFLVFNEPDCRMGSRFCLSPGPPRRLARALLPAARVSPVGVALLAWTAFGGRVELRGFEPLTLGLQSRCSPS